MTVTQLTAGLPAITRARAEEAARFLLIDARRDTSNGRHTAGLLLSLWDSQRFTCHTAALMCVDIVAFVALLDMLIFLRANKMHFAALLPSREIDAIIAQWGYAWTR